MLRGRGKWQMEVKVEIPPSTKVQGILSTIFMKKLTILIIISAIGTMIYKFFWVTIALIFVLLIIRIINQQRKSYYSNEPKNCILWEKWDR